MASWEDGPEYAPLERPAEFDPADSAPLDVGPPFVQPAADAPRERPSFDGPAVAPAPLATLVPAESEDRRDPNRPFEVVAATMTDSSSGPSAWGSVRGGPAGMTGVSAPNAVPTWGPPTGMPVAPGADPFGGPAASNPAVPSWPAPTDPMRLASGPAAGQNGFPAPGTNGWFGYGAPPPAAGPGPAPTPRMLAQAITPPVIIFLLLAIIYPLSPIFFVIAWALSSKITVARRRVLQSYGASVALIVIFFLIFNAVDDSGTGWYGAFTLCTMFFCFAELIVIGLLVWNGLKHQPYGSDRYQPPRSPWG